MHDLKFAFRQLRKSPGFTAVAVLTLGLGIGANTAIYSLVQAMFFRALPVAKPHELVVVLQNTSFIPLPLGLPYADFKDLRERNHAFSDLIAYMPAPAHFSRSHEPAERAWIELVSPNYFSMLGVSAQLGRLFQTQEGRTPGADPLLVLTHAFWQQRFGGDPGIVGQPVLLNGRPFTVIGVTPPAFRSTEWALAVSAFVPATMAGAVMPDGEEFLNSRHSDAFRLMGRLKPGTNLEQARSEFGALYQQLAREYPKSKDKKQLLLVPESRARPDPALSELAPLLALLFLGLAGLVLLVACANVANLMLARGIDRARELAIRSSLGASRGCLLRQLLTESVLLSLVAGTVAIAVAACAGSLLRSTGPPGNLPIRMDHGWDWTVPLFTVLIALLAGILTGLLPALRATRPGLNTNLKESSAAATGPARHRLRNLLVVSQVALCLVLLICAGLFFRSLQRAGRLELGFRPEKVLLASVDLGLKGYPTNQARLFHRRLLDKVRAWPGVEAAGLSSALPFDYQIDFISITVDGGIPQANDDYLNVNYAAVSEDYFAAAGTPLLQGRAFTSFDNADGPRVAVVNETMAQRLWPGENPIGKRLRLRANGPWAEVVGLTVTGKYFMLSEEPRPYLYLPLAQEHAGKIHLFARSRPAPAALAPAVRDSFASLDPQLPVFNLLPLERHLHGSVLALMPLRLGMILAGAQGILGLLLGMMGLYAVVACVVRSRTREIGVRAALGARPADILRLVIRDGMRLWLVGAVVGLILAFAAGIGLSRVLFGVRAVEPAVFIGVLVLLGLAALLACWLPARRATKVDPMEALRHE
jgi:predicted permease